MTLAFYVRRDRVYLTKCCIFFKIDDVEESQSLRAPSSQRSAAASPRSLLTPSCCSSSVAGDEGDFFITGGSRQRRRKLPLSPREELARKKPFKRKIIRHCVVSGFYLITTKQSVRVETAITQAMVREGRVDVHRGLVYDPDSGAMVTVGEALGTGSIVGLVFTKSEVEQTGEKTYWLEIFHKRHETYLVEGIYDISARRLVHVEEALAAGLIDPVHGLYRQTVTGETITLEDAHQQGLIKVVTQLRPPCSDLAARKFDTIHVRTIEGDLPVRVTTVKFKETEEIINIKENIKVSDLFIRAFLNKVGIRVFLYIFISLSNGLLFLPFSIPSPRTTNTNSSALIICVRFPLL